MSQYRAYPAYKDSGVEWIGQVPEHWKVARVKRLASLRNERRNDVSTDTIYIGLEDVEAGSGQYKPTNGSSRQSEDSTVGIFYEGDVLYGKLRPYLRKAIISEMAGCCSTEFLVLRAEKTEPRWLQEWLLTPDVTHQIVSGCEGAKMPRADWGHIGSIEVVYPDQPEQAKILTSLDRETARIDALIEKKTRFIELLNEKRQALITHAVTKGLDPNVKMKDSGVEWIGQVPEHWQIAQLKRLVSIQNGSDHKAIETDEGYPVYGSGGRFAYASSYMHDGESVLLGRKGTIDRPMYVNGRFWTVDTMYWTKILANADGKFFYYAATTIPFSYYATNTALPSMTQTSLGAHLMAYPPLEEQSTIAATLDRETARIDALIGKAEHSITLLKERRSAFITAAVTGQIDLREEA